MKLGARASAAPGTRMPGQSAQALNQPAASCSESVDVYRCYSAEGTELESLARTGLQHFLDIFLEGLSGVRGPSTRDRLPESLWACRLLEPVRDLTREMAGGEGGTTKVREVHSPLSRVVVLSPLSLPFRIFRFSRESD